MMSEIWKRQRDEFFQTIRQTQEQANLDPELAQRLAEETIQAVRAEPPAK